MRIIHVIDDLNEQAGGPAQACIEMAAAVAALGHHVSIYAFGGRRPAWFPPTGSLPMTLRHLGVDVHLFPGRSGSIVGPAAGLHDALARAIPDADVVHAHVLYGSHLWAASRLCRRHRVPLVVRPCGILNAYVSSLRRVRERLVEVVFQNRLLRQATMMHYTTEQEAIDSAPFARNPCNTVIPLGVSPEAYRDLPSRSEFDRRYPEASGRKVVLYFGRLHRKKRLDLVVQAASAAWRGGHDVHLLIVGSDDGMGAECRRLVQQAGLCDRTTFTGLLVGEAKRLVFAGADVFILPSMTENFGIAVAEAAAARIPLLISDRVNIAPVFASDDAAVVVPTEAEAVSEGLQSILNCPERARSMARRAQDIVERQFSWAAVATKLVGMYWSIECGSEQKHVQKVLGQKDFAIMEPALPQRLLEDSCMSAQCGQRGGAV
jgi:glycosyltransferase involved in cell wall biosynthesis